MPSDKTHTEDNIISNGVLALSTERESTILRKQLSPNEYPLKQMVCVLQSVKVMKDKERRRNFPRLKETKSLDNYM